MRNWPQDDKQTLRMLAAARYFLPQMLDSAQDLLESYERHMRAGEFQSALELLEQIGDQHSGYEDESHFWKELFYLAKHLELSEHAARYEEHVHQIAEMQRLF